MTTTQTAERPAAQPTDSDGKHWTHIVKRPDDEPSAAVFILKARVLGLEVEAMCGYRWTPARDPDRHPLCPECVRRFDGEARAA